MSTKKTFVALAAGLALGAVAGVLLAPASGKRTRKKIVMKAEDVRDQLTDLIDQGGSLVKDVKRAAKKASAQVDRMMHHTKGDDESSEARSKHAADKG